MNNPDNSPVTTGHWLDRVERTGNALPHPVALFAMGLALVMALMRPYALAFALVWPVLLGLWVFFGIPPGPGAPVAVG